MLFVKLTGGPFLRGQYLEICRVWGLFERTSDFQTASVGVWGTIPVCIVTRDGPNVRLWH